MLTRAKIKTCEGELVSYNPNIGHAQRGRRIEDDGVGTENEKAFHKAFYQMADMVEELFAYYQERKAKKENKKAMKIENDAYVNLGNGRNPPKPSSPYWRSSSSSSSSSHHSSFHHKYFFKKQLLKLYVKFYFPIYNGELDVEKLDNWVK